MELWQLRELSVFTHGWLPMTIDILMYNDASCGATVTESLHVYINTLSNTANIMLPVVRHNGFATYEELLEDIAMCWRILQEQNESITQ